MMKIGLNFWIWESPFRTDRHLNLLPLAKSMGAEVVEFTLEDDVLVDTAVLRHALRDHGLECSTIGLFGSQRDLSSDDAAVRAHGMEYAKRSLDTTAEFGGALFSGAVVGVGGDQLFAPAQLQTRLNRTAECLRELGEYSAKLGMLLCIEVLNRYETNLINTAEQARDLIALVNHPTVGIHLDNFHMGIEERSLGQAIRTAGDKLFHFHASESHRGMPGDGHVNWDEVARALRDVRFERFAVIESFNPRGRLAPLSRFWRSYADSPDTLARSGIAFVRKALLGGAVSAHSN
jgi:D-psicose/D-tagatose/L-ribulose 3-epimerase